jgi:hypothetical protein
LVGVWILAYRDKKVVGVFVRFSRRFSGLVHMSHIRCMYLPNIYRSRIVEDSPGWLGMVSHVSFGACTSQGTHLHQRWARIVEDSQDGAGWSHMSH